jgi:pilus assembly protein Flp/PilA
MRECGARNFSDRIYFQAMHRALRGQRQENPDAKHGIRRGTMRVVESVKRFAKDESGATAIEYGLIAAGISVAIIGVLAGTKDKLVGTLTKVQDGLN